jgi:4-hydroxy-tetrahydrodipicolinate synthase
MSLDMIRGCGTALVTPFDAESRVDETALRALVDWQIEQGVHFLVPCGSTGEASTLSTEEHLRAVAIVVEQTEGRVPVVAGAGSNDTQKAIELTRQVEAAGATHLLHVAPAYNRPPQRGLVAHFTAIADEATVPLVLYNVPGRTACNIEAETTLELAAHENIIATKEASGSEDQVSEIIRHRPDGFSVLSGDDSLTLPFMSLGADGVISVISNAAPAAMAQLVNAIDAGDFDEARRLHYRMLPLMRAALVESNPIPVKAALANMGRIQDALRLPLVPLADEHRSAVFSATAQANTTP